MLYTETHLPHSTIQVICSYSWAGRASHVSDPKKISYPHPRVLAKHSPKMILNESVTPWTFKLLSLSDENLHILCLTAESVEPTELWEMGFFFCLLLKSLQGQILPSFPSMSIHQGQRCLFIQVIKRVGAGAKHQTEACLTWVTGGLFTVPLQFPMPANTFPVVSCAWDSRQFLPCLIIPGTNSFSGILEVKW